MQAGPHDEAPEVSVIIPTRDRCARLGATLASVRDQVDVDLEVVVVDDGSADQTRFWLEAVASERLRVVRHPTPRGLPQARNTGVGAARGAMLAFLDDDDVWAPEKLRAQLDAMAADGASWAYCAAVNVGQRLETLAVKDAPPVKGLADTLLLEQVIPAGSSNVVVRASTLAEAGGFDEAFPHLADWDLFIRLAQDNYPASVPGVLVACVHHRRTMHAGRRPAGFLRELNVLLDKHEGLRESRGLVFDERPFVHWVAASQVQGGRPWSAAVLYVRDGWRHRDATSVRRAARSFLGASGLRAPVTDSVDLGWLDRYREVRP